MSFSRSYRLSLYLGNLLEHYDTALYTFLSPLFATLFFPDKSPLQALIFTLSFLPLGKIAKPVGALFFGYLGDQRGRAETLAYTLIGMSLATCLIGCIPTHEIIGWWAPCVLLMIRIAQNFCAAGEVIGGAVHLIEGNTTNQGKDLSSSLWGSSTIAGILLASLATTLLYHFNWIEKGWRFLYFGGAFTGMIGAYIRIKTHGKFYKSSFPLLTDHLKMLWEHREATLKIMIAAGFSYATYALSFILMISFIPMISDISKRDLMAINTYLLALDGCLLPVFGWVAGRISRTTSMILAAAAAILLSLPLVKLLSHATFGSVLIARITIIIVGVWFSSTFHSWAQSIVPERSRYSTISIAYALGSQLLGGTTPVISLMLYKYTESIASITWYWCALALAAMLCIIPKSHRGRTRPQIYRS